MDKKPLTDAELEATYQRHVDNVAFMLPCEDGCIWCEEQRNYDERGYELCAEE